MSGDVVIAHDYLTQRGGAERVALALLEAFPGSKLVTSVYEPSLTFPEFGDHQIVTSPLNRVARFRRDPRLAMPVLASTFSRMHVDAGVLICSSSGWSHGLSTSGRKVVYCHNPARWLYQQDDYLLDQSRSVAAALRTMTPALRRWDGVQARSADVYLANSRAVAERVENTYGRTAQIVPPPVVVEPQASRDPLPGLKPGFLLTVSRARGYKNAHAVCEAVASMPGHCLVVVGELPERQGGAAWPANIIGLRGLADAQLRWLYANCAGLVSVSHEDFGMTPLEANAFGKPVALLRAGGFLDTMAPGTSGVFIDDERPSSVRSAIEELSATVWDEGRIAAHADLFAKPRFVRAMRTVAGHLLGRDLTLVPFPRDAPRGSVIAESAEPRLAS